MPAASARHAFGPELVGIVETAVVCAHYQTTFMGYPPFAAMLSAAAMWVGQWFDIPTYLAPRYLSVLVAALTVALLGLVTRRALDNVWAGALAGILLAGSSTFGEYSRPARHRAARLRI